MLQQFFNIAIDSVSPIAKNREEVDRIMRKYPDRIPVIVTKNKNSTTTPDIDKHKYLVPLDLTIGQLQFVIRKRLKLGPEKGLFLFIDSMAVCHSELVVTAVQYIIFIVFRFLYLSRYAFLLRLGRYAFGSTFSKG